MFEKTKVKDDFFKFVTETFQENIMYNINYL